MTGGRYTSTTAPNKVFASRDELAQHYKSDWHRYNLKRKEAGLAPVDEDDFNARLEAAMALRKEREGRDVRDGRDHLKDKNKKKEPKQQQQKKESDISNNKIPNDNDTTTNDENMTDDEQQPPSNMEEDEPPPEINPLQCLFSSHTATTLDEIVTHMEQKYGFFVPDREYLVDLEGFLGYGAEKIKLGRMCLYCQKGFSSYAAVQRHMIAKGHCKVRYEEGVDLHEFEDFYDFSVANKEFLGDDETRKETTTMDYDLVEDDDDSDEWTDVEDDSDDEFDGYQDVLKTHGFGVTELGELILPDGKIVGHRALSRYYNQNITPRKNNAAVAAQKRVERERYLGYGSPLAATEGSTAPTVGGRMLRARGRDGGGILVPAGGLDGFSKISVYRYRAAVRKERREEGKGYRKKMRTFNNINRMDKKHNRLMNGVSVAHAAR